MEPPSTRGFLHFTASDRPSMQVAVAARGPLIGVICVHGGPNTVDIPEIHGRMCPFLLEVPKVMTSCHWELLR